MAHLGRVTYCFETLLLLCKLVFFNYNFHKNTRSRQKRFLSKQGQPRPLTRLKARLLTGQLKNGLFLRLHYSVHYYRLAILPIVILTLFCKYVFPSQISPIPLQPYLYSSGFCVILHRFKTNQTNKQYNLCEQWFPQCSGYHVRHRKVASSNLAGIILLFSFLETNQYKALNGESMGFD